MLPIVAYVFGVCAHGCTQWSVSRDVRGAGNHGRHMAYGAIP